MSKPYYFDETEGKKKPAPVKKAAPKAAPKAASYPAPHSGQGFGVVAPNAPTIPDFLRGTPNQKIVPIERSKRDAQNINTVLRPTEKPKSQNIPWDKKKNWFDFEVQDPVTGKTLSGTSFADPTEADAIQRIEDHHQEILRNAVDTLPFTLYEYSRALRSSRKDAESYVITKDGNNRMPMRDALGRMAKSLGVSPSQLTKQGGDLNKLINRHAGYTRESTDQRAFGEALDETLPTGGKTGVGHFGIPVANESLKQVISENPGIATDNAAISALRDGFWWLNNPATTSRQLNATPEEAYSEGGKFALHALDAAPSTVLSFAGGPGLSTTGKVASFLENSGVIGRAAAKAFTSAPGITANSMTGKVGQYALTKLAYDAPGLSIGIKDAGGVIPFIKGINDQIQAPWQKAMRGQDPTASEWLASGMGVIMALGAAHGIKTGTGKAVSWAKLAMNPDQLFATLKRGGESALSEIDGTDRKLVAETALRLQNEALAGKASEVYSDPKIADAAASIIVHASKRDYTMHGGDTAAVRIQDKLRMSHEVEGGANYKAPTVPEAPVGATENPVRGTEAPVQPKSPIQEAPTAPKKRTLAEGLLEDEGPEAASNYIKDQVRFGRNDDITVLTLLRSGFTLDQIYQHMKPLTQAGELPSDWLNNLVEHYREGGSPEADGTITKIAKLRGFTDEQINSALNTPTEPKINEKIQTPQIETAPKAKADKVSPVAEGSQAGSPKISKEVNRDQAIDGFNKAESEAQLEVERLQREQRALENKIVTVEPKRGLSHRDSFKKGASEADKAKLAEIDAQLEKAREAKSKASTESYVLRMNKEQDRLGVKFRKPYTITADNGTQLHGMLLYRTDLEGNVNDLMLSTATHGEVSIPKERWGDLKRTTEKSLEAAYSKFESKQAQEVAVEPVAAPKKESQTASQLSEAKTRLEKELQDLRDSAKGRTEQPPAEWGERKKAKYLADNKDIMSRHANLVKKIEALDEQINAARAEEKIAWRNSEADRIVDGVKQGKKHTFWDKRTEEEMRGPLSERGIEIVDGYAQLKVSEGSQAGAEGATRTPAPSKAQEVAAQGTPKLRERNGNVRPPGVKSVYEKERPVVGDTFRPKGDNANKFRWTVDSVELMPATDRQPAATKISLSHENGTHKMEVYTEKLWESPKQKEPWEMTAKEFADGERNAVYDALDAQPQPRETHVAVDLSRGKEYTHVNGKLNTIPAPGRVIPATPAEIRAFDNAVSEGMVQVERRVITGAGMTTAMTVKRGDKVGNVTRSRGMTPEASHKLEVQKALAEGKPVPAEVLADYPDLDPKQKKEVLAQNGDGKTWTYALNNRPASPGAVPKGFVSVDPKSKSGKFGSVTYDRPLTLDEIKSHELSVDKSTTGEVSLDVWEHSNRNAKWFPTYEAIKNTPDNKRQAMLDRAEKMGGVHGEAADNYYAQQAKEFTAKQNSKEAPAKETWAMEPGHFLIGRNGEVRIIEKTATIGGEEQVLTKPQGAATSNWDPVGFYKTPAEAAASGTKINPAVSDRYAIEPKEPLNQAPKSTKKGTYLWDEATQKGILTLNKNADASTVIHELQHHFLQTASGQTKANIASWALKQPTTPEQAEKIMAEGSKNPRYVRIQESFAYATEQSLKGKFTGPANIQEAMDAFRGYLGSVKQAFVPDEVNLNQGLEQANPQTKTPEFKKWFGESKVVDEKGEPLVVYHGTRSEFDKFNPKKSFGNLGAVFVSEDGAFATSHDYAATDRGGRGVPLYAKLENPFDATNKAHVEKVIAKAESLIGDKTWDTMQGMIPTRKRVEMAVSRGHNFASLEHPDVFKWIKSAGFDGAIVSENGVKNYAVFNPKNLKSAIANSGKFDPKNPSILHQEGPALNQMPNKPKELAPTFYSKAERTINEKLPSKASADQIRNTLLGAGVKPEEMKYSGLDDLLSQGGVITKQELLDHLTGNQIKIEEVGKGSAANDAPSFETSPSGSTIAKSPSGDWLGEIIPMGEGKFRLYDSKGAMVGYRDSLPAAKEYFQSSRVLSSANPTKFAQYTLPGGENYRELLLTLPTTQSRYNSALDAIRAKYNLKPGEGWGNRVTEKERAQLERLQSEDAPYRSSHWDEPNVLAHVRFDDRKGPNGEKILHVAEIQSDWHQAGRKGGYTQDVAAMRVEFEKAYETMKQGIYDNAIAEGTSEQFAKNFAEKTADRIRHGHDSPGQYPLELRPLMEPVFNLGERIRGNVRDAVPDAPFKKTWHELAFKRMLRHAAENGYDKITWDTGATSADRYDLSKQIQRLEVERIGGGGDDQYVLTAKTPDGRTVDVGSHTSSTLADAIGKEMAERIINNPDKVQKYEGLELQVGGEGMKGFYDKILPDFANKYTKKWGGKVESGSLKARTNNSALHVVEDGGKFYVEHVSGEAGNYGYYDTRTAAMDRVREVEKMIAGNTTPVHSLTITPEMKASVLGEGQPLFQGKKTKLTPHDSDFDKLMGEILGGEITADHSNAFEKEVGRATSIGSKTPPQEGETYADRFTHQENLTPEGAAVANDILKTMPYTADTVEAYKGRVKDLINAGADPKHWEKSGLGVDEVGALRAASDKAAVRLSEVEELLDGKALTGDERFQLELERDDLNQFTNEAWHQIADQTTSAGRMLRFSQEAGIDNFDLSKIMRKGETLHDGPLPGWKAKRLRDIAIKGKNALDASLDNAEKRAEVAAKKPAPPKGIITPKSVSEATTNLKNSNILFQAGTDNLTGQNLKDLSTLATNHLLNEVSKGNQLPLGRAEFHAAMKNLLGDVLTEGAMEKLRLTTLKRFENIMRSGKDYGDNVWSRGGAGIIDDPAVNNARQELAQEFNRLHRPVFFESLRNIVRSLRLMSVKNRVIDVISNTGNTGLETGQKPLTAAADALLWPRLRKSAGKANDIAEVVDMVRALRGGAKRWGGELVDQMKVGDPHLMSKYGQRVEAPGPFKYAGRAAGASDIVFKDLAEVSTAAAIDRMQPKMSPEAKAALIANEALEATFNNDNGLARAIKAVENMIQRSSGKNTRHATGLLFDLFVPFPKVIANIVGRTGDYAFGAAKGVYRIGKGHVAKEFTIADRRAINRLFARNLVGLGLAYGSLILAKKGVIQPLGLSENGTYLDWGNQDQDQLAGGASKLVTSVAGAYYVSQLPRKVAGQRNAPKNAVTDAQREKLYESLKIDAFLSSPIMTGISDVSDYTKQRKTLGKIMGQKVGNAVIPAEVRNVAKAMDNTDDVSWMDKLLGRTTQRKADNFQEEVQSRIPVWRQELPERYGQKKKKTPAKS